MTTRPLNTSTMLCVTDGRRCAGFLINRGKAGWEAYSANEISLGVFSNMAEAARAIPVEPAA